MKKIIHISPALPPAINGLGDFCQILAANLEKAGYTDNIFMLRQSVPDGQHRNVRVFNAQNFSSILSEYNVDVVILHYVGHAYDRSGLPFYVVNGLRKCKDKLDFRLLVFFHELYASSASPLKLPFYTSQLQKLIVNQLWHLADKAFTSCTRYKELLQEIVGADGAGTLCTGIFSNVPDDLYNEQTPKEEGSMLVFGSTHRRNAVYRHREFPDLIDRLRIRRLYDVGPGETHCALRGVDIQKKGALLPIELASCLNAVKFGALSYSPHLLGKSGIFSAYTAFGVIPFNLPSKDQPLYDGLVQDKNYFSPDSKTAAHCLNDSTARSEVLKWYHTHDQKTVTEKLRACL